MFDVAIGARPVGSCGGLILEGAGDKDLDLETSLGGKRESPFPPGLGVSNVSLWLACLCREWLIITAYTVMMMTLAW